MFVSSSDSRHNVSLVTTRQRGNETEAIVLAALVQDGYRVLLPFGEGHPYDLAVELESTFVRVQCKTARRRGGCLAFNAVSTDHGQGPRSYRGLADVFGVYFRDQGSVYLVPINGVAMFEGRLRFEATRNNQTKGVRLAADFEIGRWTAERLANATLEQRDAATGAPALA
jgi:hypothetical protein